MGKIVVIEGIDGCGKNTQSKLLKERLVCERVPLYKVSFPKYQEESSYFVRQYLSGVYGENADKISAEEASMCYAMDRFHQFKIDGELKEAVNDPDVLILADRYTTSNIIFQASKKKTEEEMLAFIDWLCEMEYDKLCIPRPDLVLMPHLSFEANMRLIANRDIHENAQANHMTADIHEANVVYLKRVHATSELIAKRLGFRVIDCMKLGNDDEIRSVEDVHEEMYDEVMKLIKTK